MSSTLRCCSSVGRTHMTCESALPSVRQGKPSKRSQRTQWLFCGSCSSRRTPTGRWKGLSPRRARSSCRRWMRGSWLTAGHGYGPAAGGSGGASPRRACPPERGPGLVVVRREVVVGDRPRGRHAAVVADLREVALAQPEEDRAVELRVAADEVLLVGLEVGAVLVEPLFTGQVA